MEEAVKKGTVRQKKLSELLINSEDAMAVDDIYIVRYFITNFITLISLK